MRLECTVLIELRREQPDRMNAKESAELEAYGRARSMDLKTIERQNEEIEDLVTKNKELHKENRSLKLERTELMVTKNALVRHNEELRDKLRRKNDAG